MCVVWDATVVVPVVDAVEPAGCDDNNMTAAAMETVQDDSHSKIDAAEEIMLVFLAAKGLGRDEKLVWAAATSLGHDSGKVAECSRQINVHQILRDKMAITLIIYGAACIEQGKGKLECFLYYGKT